MGATVISLVSKKGGVGKTTLTINLAGALSKKKKKVLVVDMEGQASLSQFFLGSEAVETLPKSRTTGALFDVALELDCTVIIQATHNERIWLAPSSETLAKHELPEPEKTGVLQFALRDFVQQVSKDFDYIIVDTPPNLYGLLTWSSLQAAHYVVTPLLPDTFSAQALIGVQRMVEKAIQCGNPRLVLLGYVINFREKQPVLQKLTEEQLRKLYGNQVFSTVIGKMQAYADAIPYQKTITEYQGRSVASKTVEKLADEMLKRINKSDQSTKKRKAA